MQTKNETQNKTQNLDDFLKTISDLEKAIEVIRNYKNQVDELVSMENRHFKRVEQVTRQFDKLSKLIDETYRTAQKNNDSVDVKKMLENILFLMKNSK